MLSMRQLRFRSAAWRKQMHWYRHRLPLLKAHVVRLPGLRFNLVVEI